MTTTLGKTRRTVLSFNVILVVFLIVADGLVITQQTNLLRTEMTSHTKYEFDLFGKLVAGSLTKGDYTAVEEAVIQWGRERQNILELNITTANGFTIANFMRDNSATESRRFQGKLEFGIDNIVTITMVKDMSAVNVAINKLAYQLVAFSIVLVALLGFLLQRMAFRPLQKEINEHEQTEKKLHQQAVELRESNMELESYSYSIAHDLRAPLRSVTSFSQVLLEDADEKLDADEKDSLQRVIKAGKYMAQLIDDILELARITRSEFKTGVADLSALAHAAVERLCESGLVRNVACNIQDGLVATGDRKLLAVVLENLLGNACKYTSKTEHARIEFGAKEKDGETIYFIRDNGVGFDMKYADKLFGAFQRLHQRKEFEGTGIGLAIVARIINRHGGRVWAEGEVGKGATFYFTLL